MILLAVLILSAFLAYQGMTAGIYPALSRCAMAAVSISAGVGFAGPLYRMIPSDNEYLYGACMLAIAVVAYLLQRGLADYCLSQRPISLPVFVDRIGGALGGLVGGLISLGFLCLVAVALPLPKPVKGVTPQLERAAGFAVSAARFVEAFAGTGEPITLDTIMPRKPERPATSTAPENEKRDRARQGM